MSTLDLSFQQDHFKKYVSVSLGAHLLLFLFLTVKTVFFAGEPLIYESAIKVDLVGLPDKIDPHQISPPAPAPAETEKSPPAPIPAPAADAKKPKLVEKVKKVDLDPEAINLEKTKKKQAAALDRLKQMSALEEIEKQVQDDKKNRTIENLKKIKGNALSSGSQLTGVNRLQHDSYISVVEHHIRQHWSLPEWLAKKSLKAQVRVRFDENGNVIEKEIYKGSGNPSFDEEVLNTVERSSPVPAPPAKFVRILNSEGILLGFPE